MAKEMPGKNQMNLHSVRALCLFKQLLRNVSGGQPKPEGDETWGSFSPLSSSIRRAEFAFFDCSLFLTPLFSHSSGICAVGRLCILQWKEEVGIENVT